MKQQERKEHFTVMYCESCKLAYETYSYANKKYISYHRSFPTYKLNRLECPNHDKNYINYLIEEVL